MTDEAQNQSTQPGQTGRVKAGRDIESDHVVTGAQVRGGDAESARDLLALAQDIQSGDIEAVRDIVAQNIVTGLQYLGQGGTEPTLEQFRQELVTLREQLAQAIKAGEIADKYQVEDSQKAVERAIEQAQADKPVAEKVITHLDRAATIIEQAARAAEAAGKFGARVIGLVPVVMTLKRLADFIFSNVGG